MSDLELVGTRLIDRRTKDAVRQLFDADGTIYLVTGFFTANAYRDLADEIHEFLDRNPDNELVLVVGSGIDQFSVAIARDLWGMEHNDRIQIYMYPHGFLHAKLFLRTGSDPIVIIGSANLTRVALEQNLELGVILRDDDVSGPTIDPFVEWLDDLIAVSVPVEPGTLSVTRQVVSTASNWVNKGRLLPARQLTIRMTPVIVFVGLLLTWMVF